jgi:ATP-dependent helicase/nuclease subunit A
MPQQPLKLLRASAGSGKTFSLTLHYLTLLFSGPGKYKEILAVTFTNKATAEMKERILGALQAIAKGEKSDFTPLLQQNYPFLTSLDIQTQAQDIYSSILHDYGRFSVSTIDGFVQKVIRSFAFELNLDSGYKLEMNQDKVKDELVKALNVQLENDPGLLEWVTALAIERISDGKDWNYQRALKDLANEIFKERYYPFQEAMLTMGEERGNHFKTLKQTVTSGIKTFNKTIFDLVTDIKYIFDLSGVEADDLARKSVNPLLKLDKILKEDYTVILSLATLVDDYAAWQHKSSKNAGAVEQLYTDLNPLVKKLVLYYLEHAEEYDTWQAIHKNSSYLRLMQEMASLLKDYRSENKALLISDAQQLLTGITGADSENPSFIWEKTGNRYKHFLFDEFQDTSTMQWINFLPLIKNALAEFEGKSSEHLIVGDVKQSIYRWRSGDWRILHSNVKRDILHHNVEEERLEYNRRSAANIIKFNNFLYANLPEVFQRQLNQILVDTDKPELIQYWNGEYNQIIERAYEDNQQQVTPQTAEGGRIEVRFLSKDEEDDLDEESPSAAIHTVNKIEELLSVHGFAMKDICILVRANHEAERIITCLLDKQTELSAAAGKTFQVISGDALKIEANLAVQLIVNIFRMLAVRTDEQPIFRATCARLYNHIKYPEGVDHLVNLVAADWMKIAGSSIEALSAYFPEEFCLNFNSYRQLPMAELMEKMVQLFGLGTPQNASHIPFLLALRDQVAVFAAGGDQGLNSFLEWWNEEGYKKSLPASDQQDAVQIMTIHKSKGLEFKAVLIPFLNWKLNTPSGFLKKILWVDAGNTAFGNFSTLPVDYSSKLASTTFAREYFEEMLLNYMDTLNTLYVATTRARDFLYLVCPKTTLVEKAKEGPKNELQNILLDLFKLNNEPDFILDDQSFSYGSFPVRPFKESIAKNLGLEISTYEVNDQLSARFNYQVSSEDNWYNARQRKGIVLHKILESLTNLEELDKFIAEYMQEGLIRHGEKDEVKQAVTEVLKQTTIAGWFKAAKSIISERDMILEGGEIKRPDKLFVMEDGAVLLDFKFGAEQEKYIEDINLYKNNLLKMQEFKQVDAYIWYAETQKLLKV